MTAPTTHNDPPAGRKPRRLGLYLPWGFALLLAIGWSIAWLWMASETGRRLDAATARMRASGWQVAWASRHVGGYPFRLDVDLTGLSLADPAGWAVSAPQIKSEAFVFAPTHWLFAVPNGFSFTRPGAGAVVVTAKLLRASLNSWDQHPPRLSLEGDDMTFTPAPGAKPFWLTRAHVLLFDTRAGPDDQGASYFSIADGAADPASFIGRVAQGQSVGLVAETTFNHASAIAGPGWRGALTHWAHAGGKLDIDRFNLTAGGAGLESRSGSVTVGDDGYLTGAVDLRVNSFERFLAGFGPPAANPAKPRVVITLRSKSVTGPPSDLPLTFNDRAAWLGPLKLGPAPRAF